MKGPSRQQQKIIEFIREFIEKNGMSPTIYEIAERLSIKASTVSAHIAAMQKKHLLTRTAHARSIKIINMEDMTTNYTNKQDYYPLYHHPMDIDFSRKSDEYIYHTVQKQFQKYQQDICLLECNFKFNNEFCITAGDIITLIRKPEPILLQSGVLLLAWSPDCDYFFTQYNALEYAQDGYKIIGLILDLQRKF